MQRYSLTSKRFFVITVVVIVFFHILCASTVPSYLTMDSNYYYNCALSIVSGGPILLLEYRTLGYPLFLAGVFSIFGDSVEAISAIQHLLIIIASLCCWVMLPKSISNFYRSIVTLSIGANPLLAFQASSIMSESLFTALIIIGLLLIFYETKYIGIKYFLNGIILGLASNIRTNGFVSSVIIITSLLLILLYERFLSKKEKKIELISICRFATGVLIIVLPWIITRYFLFNELGMTENYITNAIRMEMLQSEEFDSDLFKDSKIKMEWDQPFADWSDPKNTISKLGWSFYYYITPKLVSKFGKERVYNAYDRYFKEFTIKHPVKIAKRMAIVFFGHANIVPRILISGYGHHYNSIYSEAKRYLFNDNEYKQLITNTFSNNSAIDKVIRTSQASVISKTIYLKIIDIWQWLQWAFMMFLLYSLYSTRKHFAANLLAYIPIVVFFVNCLALTWLLTPYDRYSAPLWPLLCIGHAMIASLPKKNKSIVISEQNVK